MKSIIIKIFILLILSSSLVCSSEAQLTQYYFTESTEDFPNPDRGFYHPLNGVASNFVPLDALELAALRNGFTPWQANYDVKTSVVFRHYVLDSYVNTDVIPETFLQLIQDDIDAARTAGVRLMLRFSYTITPQGGDCGSWICPPYGDAPKDRILAHITQLTPIFQNNEDVILALQSGFIGMWGEQYYSDYFGDPQFQGFISDQNWTDRLDVLSALLDALPESRMVLVRYPQIKQKLLHGLESSVNSPNITPEEAFTSADIARIGFHNDCFLSATDDQGTYWDYGNSTTPASDQTAALKAYAQEESKYVFVGGETCSDAFSPENNCASEGGSAVDEMDALNYSVLNSDYNNEVNNDWQTGGCMDEIKRRLGYRYRLVSRTDIYNYTFENGLYFDITIRNDGFTACMLEKKVDLIARNSETLQEFAFEIDTDARSWTPGEDIVLELFFDFPESFVAGEYDLFLHIKDIDEVLSSRSEFSIRLANNGLWETTTGYNSLDQSIFVSYCLGDVNSDQFITALDLSHILGELGCTENCKTDLDGNGSVTVFDLTIFLGIYGTPCD